MTYFDGGLCTLTVEGKLCDVEEALSNRGIDDYQVLKIEQEPE